MREKGAFILTFPTRFLFSGPDFKTTYTILTFEINLI